MNRYLLLNMAPMISQKYDSIKAHFGVVIGATYMSMDEGTTHLSIGDDHEIFNLGAQTFPRGNSAGLSVLSPSSLCFHNFGEDVCESC